MIVSIQQDPTNPVCLAITDGAGTVLGVIGLTDKGLEHKQEVMDQLSQHHIEEKSGYYALRDVAELTGALESLVNRYIASLETSSLGTPSEFINCITPNNIPWYWVRAKQALELGQRRLKLWK